MGLIRLNYTQTIREANRLKTVGNDCKQINNLIDRLISQIPTYWQGDSARAFIEEMNQLKRENSSISAEANNLGTTVQRVANEIRTAERRAAVAMKE